jgi:hypothetical protein
LVDDLQTNYKRRSSHTSSSFRTEKKKKKKNDQSKLQITIQKKNKENFFKFLFKKIFYDEKLIDDNFLNLCEYKKKKINSMFIVEEILIQNRFLFF